MSARFTAACALGLLLAAVAPAQDDPAAAGRKALQEIEGVYALQAMEAGGVKAKPEFVRDRRFVVRSDARGYLFAALTWRKAAREDGVTEDRVDEEAMRVTVDPSKKPATIDFDEPIGEGKFRRTHGIYKFEDETLTICASDSENPADRPTAFTTTPARPKDHLLVLKRVQAGKKP